MQLYSSLKFLTVSSKVRQNLKNKRFEKINKIVNNVLTSNFIEIK